ncbi:MAG: isocitrate/isopropylmalate dehydrogenase family protein [Candidatus Nitrosoabyssus spongiisocia]|nr:MAG: isocitrate/isopropylmalate dehydrogenase family protein [Nitrosopumilaceae archaeon AB1(1)]
MTFNISLITGDGVGPDLADSTVVILNALQDSTNLSFNTTLLPAGDLALSKYGSALPQDTLDAIQNSDACIKAPVGESAKDVIVHLRQKLNLYANIRPAKSYSGMPSLFPNVDMVIVRENTEDLYTGAEFDIDDDSAIAMRIITYAASKRIAQYAYSLASGRRNKVLCVHKSNVLKKTDGIFIRACKDVSETFPDIPFEQMYVDACAMNLIRNPESFDVIVTTNMFGDILSDESSQVVGGLGMAPAANIGDNFALFEPVHGAAFDIAEDHIVNPDSIILSIKMMLEWLGSKHDDLTSIKAAKLLEDNLLETIRSGVSTPDIGGGATTSEFTEAVASRIRSGK